MIDKGSEAAWTVKALVEAFVVHDEARMAEALTRAETNLPRVTYHLIVVAGGAIQTVANLVGEPLEKTMGDLFVQIAKDSRDDEPARVMREMVTAWSTGDDALAHAVNASGALQSVHPNDLILHFLGITRMIVDDLAKWSKQPADEWLEGMWVSLGVEGDDPY